jgi:adenine-specific DNA-methyltransferase
MDDILNDIYGYMNYLGSKKKLLNFIKYSVYEIVGNNLQDKVFCDLFAGTGIVGYNFKKEVKKVISNDLEYYSYVLNRNYIDNNFDINLDEYFKILNDLPLITDGFIYQNYCSGGKENRLYFSDHNGKKIDTIRQQIKKWKEDGTIGDGVYYHLLASLLECADKVANTASMYGAYLKKLNRYSSKELILVPTNFDISRNKGDVYNSDSNKLITEIEGDILYLDPPYNSRQYGSNYHMLNTIANNEEFIPVGITGLPKYNRSKYCVKSKVLGEFEYLIKNAKFKYIFLSYNNEGLMSVDDVKSVMEKYGEYSLFTTHYKRFIADKDINRKFKANSTEEYLHVLIKKEDD